MQISKINNACFGLKVSERAQDYFYKKYKNNPDKLNYVDYLAGKYPDNIVLDIKELENTNTNTTKNKLTYYCLNDKINKRVKAISLLTGSLRELDLRIKSFIKNS